MTEQTLSDKIVNRDSEGYLVNWIKTEDVKDAIKKLKANLIVKKSPMQTKDVDEFNYWTFQILEQIFGKELTE